MNHYRYDDRARLVFHFARKESARLGHAMIGPEHLLLGLMRAGDTASRLLSEFGATLEGFRRQVEEMVGRGDGLPRNETAAITPRARRVMELAGSEARSLGSTVIATEHILLGIIREGDGVAYRILQQLTRDVDTVRWRILAAADPKAQAKPSSEEDVWAPGGYVIDYTHPATWAFSSTASFKNDSSPYTVGYLDFERKSQRQPGPKQEIRQGWRMLWRGLLRLLTLR